MAKAKKNSQVEQAIKKIEDRYAIGQVILKECGPTSPHGVITELAEQYGINRDSAQKLRAMASKETGYTKRELNQWFKLFRKEDHALSISLTQEALTNRWSSHRLQAEILARQGRRQEGGRRPTVITGEVFEAELERTLWAWDRWLELHLEGNPQVRPEIAKDVRQSNGRSRKSMSCC
jgi:hypothetical protein